MTRERQTEVGLSPWKRLLEGIDFSPSRGFTSSPYQMKLAKSKPSISLVN